MKKEEKRPTEPEKKDIGEELESIYADKDGSMPDFTRLEGRPTSRLKSFMVGLFFFLLVVAGVTWGGIWYFSKDGGGFTGEKVEVTVVTEDSFTAGAETEIVLHYRNRENVPLASAVLTAELPDGFVLLSAEPRLDEDGEWELGSVAPDGDGSVRLRGWIREEPEAALTFKAKLRYNPADFSSPFEQVSSHTVVVSGSVFEVEATAPEKMTPGDEIELSYLVRNTGDRAYTDLKFRLSPPEGFLFASAEPAPEEEGGLDWTLPVLEPESETTVSVRGTFSAETRGPKSIGASVGFSADEAFIAAASGSASTEVLKSALALGLIVNGTTSDTTASFGELLNVTVTYKNEGEVDLRDVDLTFELADVPNGLVDWISLKDDLDGDRVGDAITWSSDEIEGLERLEPGDEGTIDLSVRLSGDPVEGQERVRHALAAKVMASIGRVGTISGSRDVASTPIAIRMNSDAVFRAYGRYFTEDGVPLGSGPLPPQVGQKTVYRIFWVIENSLHELTNLTMETVMPEGARWTGETRPVEAGELSFDASGRRATWRLNRMPVSVNRLIVTFDVELTPEFEDLGRIVELTGDNRFEALDKETGSVILITEPPIDTSLPADEQAAGKGSVRQ